MKGTGRPVWEDTAPPEDLACMDPGHARLPTTPDVLVIGGGQIGLATAAMCHRAGLGTVALIDRDRLAAGPSGRNGGFLIPADHPNWPDEWQVLATKSLTLHRELDSERSVGLRVLDLLVLPSLLLADQAHVDPLRRAAGYARGAGVVATGVEATRIEIDGDRVVAVHTSHGTLQPGVVVFATGSAPAEAGDLEQGFVKGHVIATEPASFRLDKMFVVREVGIVQLADGRLVCGGTKDPADESPEIAEPSIRYLCESLASAVPEAAALAITHRWSCFRPYMPDDMPVIDRLPSARNAWVVAGLYMTGLLMAPIIGRLIAEWIGADRPPDDLAKFGSARAALRR